MACFDVDLVLIWNLAYIIPSRLATTYLKISWARGQHPIEIRFKLEKFCNGQKEWALLRSRSINHSYKAGYLFNFYPARPNIEFSDKTHGAVMEKRNKSSLTSKWTKRIGKTIKSLSKRLETNFLEFSMSNWVLWYISVVYIYKHGKDSNS